MPRALAAGVLLVLASSCQPAPDAERLADWVLASDPAFTAVWQRRQELSGQVGVLERELQLKRLTTEQAVTLLQEQLDSATADIRRKQRELAHELSGARQQVQQALQDGTAELAQRRLERALLSRTVAQLRKSPDPSASGPRDDALRALERVDRELGLLDRHCALLKAKRALLDLPLGR